MLKEKNDYISYKHEYERDMAGFIIVEANAATKP
jgi:hypothetical protein